MLPSMAIKEDGLATMAYILFLTLLFLSSSCKSADDHLTHTKPLIPDDMLISDGGDFALGFLSPTSSSNKTLLYLGIWYHSIPGRTVVWIANRDNPIIEATPSSPKLVITNNSDLVLSDSQGHAVWTTANNIAAGAGAGAGAYAVLLNSGNLVLRFPNGTDIWQSFHYPTDTILPNMKVLLSYKAQVVSRLVAWKGPDDPSSGDFSCSGDPSFPNLQLVIWQGTRPYCRITVWNSVSVLSLNNNGSIVYQTAINVGDKLFFEFTVSVGSPFTRITLDHTGRLRSLSWNNASSSWAIVSERPAAACELYASCGSFSYCDFTAGTSSTCRCLDGYEPNGPNFTTGCRRTEELKCGKQSHFLTLPQMKVPDKFLHIHNRSLEQCEDECSRNCSCTAYAYANWSSGSGNSVVDPSRCLVWTEELVDTGKSSDYGENLHLRLVDSSAAHKKGNLVKYVLLIIACMLLLTCIALIWIRKYRGKRRNKNAQKKLMAGYLSSSNELEGENIEFPFVTLEEVLAATDNFSDSNLLGRGGFGKVYKGNLQGGKEVAVKRLSKDSGQGIQEFRNEVVLIAKLQHRNLVRLLACCVHEDEKLLIYEYLPNKSLDAFLFDAARKHVLDWLTRFKIIKGVARGLLYLHQDSRLTIIHRDLKASNILLDTEMTPKISDFGMARIFSGKQQQVNTCRVVGTYGYMSPEYAMGGAFSVKSDTYSFGVLLLEILSGLKINSRQPVNFSSLITYAWRLWEDGKAIQLVDSSIIENCPLHEVLRCIHVGLLCIQDRPSDRPFMSSVMFMLENESALLPAPREPLYFDLGNCKAGETRENIEESVSAMSITTLEGR
ncbi:hypothetical protein ACQ4PT_039346 [Festuca glaucescens]